MIGSRIGEVAFERGSIDDWTRVVDVFLRHRPSAVVHAGGIMDTNLLDQNPSLALRTNVGGGVAMLEASRLVGGVERFVCFSTIAVVGKVLYQPIDANHPCITATTGPLGAYSAAKAALEAFCFSYLQAFGLDVRIVRPSALYGFGMSWFAPNYMKNIVEPAALGEPVRLATGGAVPRDYTSVADCASLVTAILDGPESADRVFYAATGRELRTASDVGEIVRDLIPGASVTIGDAMTDVDREELAIRGRYSIDNARNQLGWEPTVRRAGGRRRGLHPAVLRVPCCRARAHPNAGRLGRCARHGRSVKPAPRTRRVLSWPTSTNNRYTSNPPPQTRSYPYPGVPGCPIRSRSNCSSTSSTGGSVRATSCPPSANWVNFQGVRARSSERPLVRWPPAG